MTNPDLAALSEAATPELLSDEGHYFQESCSDLARCSHGETAYFNNQNDGPFIAALWNAYRSGNLVQIDREGMREVLARAYRQGAEDVHSIWVNQGGQCDADFGKAASDYAANNADAAIAAIWGR